MQYKIRIAVMALVTVLAGCGDGGSDGPRTSAVRVVGDSLNDSGTYGFKFTVQDALNGTKIWVDHVAEAVGVDAPCARHVAWSESSVVENPDAENCTSYAVGKGRINVWDNDPKLTAGDGSPFSIPHQLKTMSQARAFGPEELLLVDGGGNDVADLLRTFLAKQSGQSDFGQAYAVYLDLLDELLLPEQLEAAVLGEEAGIAAAGGLYMEALANHLAHQIEEQALANGAQRVVVLNIPALTQTPYLQAIKIVLTQKFGGGADGEAAAAGVLTMVDQWIQAFNSRLQTRLKGEGRVVLVDLYTPFAKWVARPADFGFTDSSSIACPPETGVQPDAFGLPVYVLGNCQAWRLSAYPPAGATGPNWWTTYVFADDFHGSPMTNRKMADLVVKTLKDRDWL